MDIVIIGSGRVAYHMAKAFTQANIPVQCIFGRNKKDLQSISDETSIPFVTGELPKADFYYICVSDDAIEEISTNITCENALVAHSSGSLPKEILKGSYRKATLYPLQTFTKEKQLDYTNIPFFVEAETGEDQEWLLDLANKISSKSMISDYEKRKYIHLTAVFACNFVNHLFTKAKEISDSQKIPFEYFYPLIEETVEKIQHMDPREAQTGPAVRNDSRILALHQKLLQNETLEIYETMNRSILSMYH